MLSLCKRLAIGTVLGLIALARCAAVRWQTVRHSGSMKRVPYLQVPTPAVDVTIDDHRYRVDTLRESPIVCKLRTGRHLLRILRSGRALFEQEFTLDPGQEVVLTAWERSNEKPAQVRRPTVFFNPALERTRLDLKRH
jgi:hypothetical protein